MSTDTLPRSELERQLLATPGYHFEAMVKEMDVLRDVLIGRIGTPAQRNALLRIIKANAPGNRLVTTKLAQHLGQEHYHSDHDSCTFTSYEASFRPVLVTAAAGATPAPQNQESEEEYDDDDDPPL